MEIAISQTSKTAAEMASAANVLASESPAKVSISPRLAETPGAADDKKLTPEEVAKQVRETTDSLNEMSSLLKYGIRFAYDDRASEMLVNVIEKDTNRVIRQIPSEEILELRARMAEMVGLLVDREA